MRKRTLMAAAVACIVAGFTIAGCGDDDNSSGDANRGLPQGSER
jgi:hypothetical protein